MPRATRDTPIAMPIGMAVTHGEHERGEHAEQLDHQKCSASGASALDVAAPRDSYERS